MAVNTPGAELEVVTNGAPSGRAFDRGFTHKPPVRLQRLHVCHVITWKGIDTRLEPTTSNLESSVVLWWGSVR